MQQNIYTLIFATTSCIITQAQYFEIGIYGGVSGYNGDLSYNIIHVNEVHPSAGIKVSLPASDYFAFNFSSKITTISGNDNNAEKIAFQARNLDFSSRVFDGGFTVDYFIFGYDPVHGEMFSPYLTTGINVFHFNPKTVYNGETYELQPLGTEGQGTSAFPDREPYKLTQFSIPIAAGIKYAATRRINIGVELTMNKTFTDYLDDVSTTYVDAATLTAENGAMSFELSNRTDEFLQSEPLPYNETQPRGNSAYKDWYGFLGLTLSYNFMKERLANSDASSIGCPKF
ncbi:MAG: hypothetical protein H7Y00_16810 [Fimbriimonadaceae bacterium]|nr:hypothetical protein [Chitinophagales bacterium]